MGFSVLANGVLPITVFPFEEWGWCSTLLGFCPRTVLITPIVSRDRLAPLTLLCPLPGFPSLGAFLLPRRQGNPCKIEILGNVFQDVVAWSQVQHLKGGVKIMGVLEKPPSNSPEPLRSSRINSDCPKTAASRNPHQSGIPGPLWSWCGQREVPCDAPRCCFASKSALCYKEGGDGDLPAGKRGCSVRSRAETPEGVTSLVEGPSNGHR